MITLNSIEYKGIPLRFIIFRYKLNKPNKIYYSIDDLTQIFGIEVENFYYKYNTILVDIKKNVVKFIIHNILDTFRNLELYELKNVREFYEWSKINIEYIFNTDNMFKSSFIKNLRIIGVTEKFKNFNNFICV